MSETDPEDTPGGAAADVPEAEETPRSRPRAARTRRITAWVLVVLASLLIPISVISVWAIRTVTNTDQYVATLAPLARNPIIVDHLAQKATDELFSTHIVQDKVTAALPAKAKPVITPIVAEVHTYVYGLALKVFESPKFGQLWDTLNRHTHDAVIDVLTGQQTPLTQRLEKGGGIVVNVTPALNNLIDQANAKGVTLFNPLKPILTKGDSLGVTMVSKSQVSKFTGLFNAIVTLKWVIPVVALVLGILGIVIAVEHRKTLLRMAIGVALFTLLLLAGLSLGRITFVNQAGHTFNRQVAGTVWDTMLRFLVGGPALDAAGRVPLRPRSLVGRPGPLRRVVPLDGRPGRPLGGRRGTRARRRVPVGAPPARTACAAPVGGFSSTSTACASPGWPWRRSSSCSAAT